MTHPLGLATLLLAAVPGLSQERAGDHLDLDRAAAEAYRASDYDAARVLWKDALATCSGRAERARLLYNLGNVAYRSGELLHAVGWYTAALRHTPRDPDLWANLELARAEAELEPADRGDLAATFQRLSSSLLRGEAEWLALLGLLPLALALAGEALRGGLVWRRMILVGVLVALVTSVPLGWHLSTDGDHRMLVVEEGGSQGRSEPRSDAKRIGRVEPGQVVAHLDALPGWIKVADEDGRELWLRERAVFDLVR